MKKLLVLTIALLAAVAPSAAHARPGALDRSFGRGGKVLRAVSGAAKTAHGVAIATSGGRIFLLSGQTLLAFRLDGSPARGFGIRGRVGVGRSLDTSLDLVDIAADREGRIVVGGTAVSKAPPPGFDYPDESLFLARFTQTGTLDKTFGNGGVHVTDLGALSPSYIFPSYTPPLRVPPSSRLGGIAMDPDGRIILSGTRTIKFGPCRGFPNWQFRDGFAARLLGNGAPDPSFGQEGVALIENALAIDPPALTSGGGPYLWSSPDNGCLSAVHRLTRLDRNGAQVPTFGESGSRDLPTEPGSGFESTITVDRRGRVLVVEEDVSSPPTTSHVIATVRRFLPDGRADQSFGRNGVVRVSGADRRDLSPSALAVDRLGGIFVAGVPKWLSPEIAPRAFLLGHLGRDGELDLGFADEGMAQIRLGRRAHVGRPALALTNRGVLMAGALKKPALPGEEGVVLVRLANR